MSGAWCTTLVLAVCIQVPVSVAIFASEPSFGPKPVVDLDSGWLVVPVPAACKSVKESTKDHSITQGIESLRPYTVQCDLALTVRSSLTPLLKLAHLRLRFVTHLAIADD